MKRILYTCFVALSLTACTEELDQVNPNSVVLTNFWKTDADFMSGLAATYKVFHDVNNGYYGVRGIELSNGRGDDFFIRNDVKDLYQLSTFTNDPTTGTPSSIFTGFYTGIFRANQIIEQAPLSAGLSEEAKKQYVAEAQFIRGVNYFLLASNFGEAPIVTKVPVSRSEYFVTKSPEADVWAQAVSDLQAAAAGLPVSYPAASVGRATKGAALGYLGKVYVYQKKWADAEAAFRQLAQPDGTAKAPFTYDLVPKFEDNFNKATDNNVESLFEIQNQNVGGSQPWSGENANEALGVTTAQEFAPTEVAGWFEVSPTDKIFNEFQKEKAVGGDFDDRMYATLVWDYPGAMYYNKPFKEFKLVFGYSSMVRKYQNWRENNEGIYISEINEKALRYADILLLYAEALTMQNRQIEAYPLLNRIRTRAKLVPLAAGLSSTQMMEEIRHQRMLEFFREGQRFYDLKRWGILEQEIKNSDKVGRQFFTAKHAYFPIPQNELNTNPSITQNSGW
ncbi:RagB/SusD family nutrient uptake outer membrane protein [Hymenobacter sp. YC55]|uniref:RagB/SusD family nutrient uptake outer membrane protein n=1 Tax=Hymenobacter sp. YC55 TaxID=3034019 RepID=UPI0023F9CBD3|nr:RagB/SusD family nutrient uptake outer membrane protein [Hymenobacter sp. YC55]MDF7812696.1 RagB/SusD family nutrient uptake outer membrane protein [Hymenobacter sp. YC55]